MKFFRPKYLILIVLIIGLSIMTGCWSNNPVEKEIASQQNEVSQELRENTKQIPLAHQEDEILGPPLPQVEQSPVIALEDPKPVPSTPPSPEVAPIEEAQPQQPLASTDSLCDHANYGGHIHYKYQEYTGTRLSVGNGQTLREEAANAFWTMKDAAAVDGITLVARSGFRSISLQDEVFKGGAREKGQTHYQRARDSAPAGYSEHSTGLALDMNSFNVSFANTQEYRWLQNNAFNYGWELSFPENNHQNIAFEPWHWRYIGVDGGFANNFCRD